MINETRLEIKQNSEGDLRLTEKNRQEKKQDVLVKRIKKNKKNGKLVSLYFQQ